MSTRFLSKVTLFSFLSMTAVSFSPLVAVGDGSKANADLLEKSDVRPLAVSKKEEAQGAVGGWSKDRGVQQSAALPKVQNIKDKIDKINSDSLHLAYKKGGWSLYPKGYRAGKIEKAIEGVVDEVASLDDESLKALFSQLFPHEKTLVERFEIALNLLTSLEQDGIGASISDELIRNVDKHRNQLRDKITAFVQSNVSVLCSDDLENEVFKRKVVFPFRELLRMLTNFWAY